MLKRSGIVLSLVLALIIAIPPQGQTRPREKTRNSEDAIRAVHRR